MFVAQLDPVVPLLVGAALTHAQNDEVPGPVREELVTGLHRQVFETLPPEDQVDYNYLKKNASIEAKISISY